MIAAAAGPRSPAGRDAPGAAWRASAGARPDSRLVERGEDRRRDRTAARVCCRPPPRSAPAAPRRGCSRRRGTRAVPRPRPARAAHPRCARGRAAGLAVASRRRSTSLASPTSRRQRSASPSPMATTTWCSRSVEGGALTKQVIVASRDDRDHRGAHASSPSTAAARSAPVPVLQRLPAAAAQPHGRVEHRVPVLWRRPTRADDGEPCLMQRPRGGELLVVRSRLGDHHGRAPGGGDVGDRVLPGVGDDDVGIAQQRPRVLDPAGAGRPERRPRPAGRRALGGRQLVDGQLRPAAAGKHDDPRASTGARSRAGRRPSKREIAPTGCVFARHGAPPPSDARPGGPRAR